MDIKGIEPTAKIGYTLDLGKGKTESINLVIAFVAFDEVRDYLPEPQVDKDGKAVRGKRPKLSTLTRDLLINAIQGWDLTENGQPIPCDEANKKKYLPIILGLRVKDSTAANPIDAILGPALLNFATDSENFLKN